MANSAQAKKRARQNAVLRLHNMAQRSAYRTAVKKVRKAIEAGDKSAAQAALQANMSVMDSLADKNTVLGAIREVFASKPKFIDINCRTFLRGYELAAKAEGAAAAG